MKGTVEDRRINRKLSTLSKGNHRALDRIQVPVHDWFYSEQAQELYHYDYGVWEAYLKKNAESFYTHHTLKVLPPRVVPVSVISTEESIAIERIPPMPDKLWQDVTLQSDIEKLLLWRNKRHLQQVDIECGGKDEPQILKEIRKTQGISALCDDILQGQNTQQFETTPEIADWFWAIRHPEEANNLDPITGVIPSPTTKKCSRMLRSAPPPAETYTAHSGKP